MSASTSSFRITGVKRKSKSNDDGIKVKKPRKKKVNRYNGRKYFEPFPKLISLRTFAMVPQEIMNLIMTDYLTIGELNSQLYAFSDEYRWQVIKKNNMKHPMMSVGSQRQYCSSCHKPFRRACDVCLRTKCCPIPKHDEMSSRIMKEIGNQRIHEQKHQEWLVLRCLPENIRNRFELALTYGMRKTWKDEYDEGYLNHYLSADWYGYKRLAGKFIL